MSARTCGKCRRSSGGLPLETAAAQEKDATRGRRQDLGKVSGLLEMLMRLIKPGMTLRDGDGDTDAKRCTMAMMPMAMRDGDAR